MLVCSIAYGQTKSKNSIEYTIEFIHLQHKIDSLELRFEKLKAEYYRTGNEKYRTMALANEPLRVRLVKRYNRVRALMLKK